MGVEACGVHILEGAGRISKAQADDHALSEFEKFRVVQDRKYVSDFDRLEDAHIERNIENDERND